MFLFLFHNYPQTIFFPSFTWLFAAETRKTKFVCSRLSKVPPPSFNCLLTNKEIRLMISTERKIVPVCWRRLSRFWRSVLRRYVPRVWIHFWWKPKRGGGGGEIPWRNTEGTPNFSSQVAIFEQLFVFGQFLCPFLLLPIAILSCLRFFCLKVSDSSRTRVHQSELSAYWERPPMRNAALTDDRSEVSHDLDVEKLELLFLWLIFFLLRFFFRSFRCFSQISWKKAFLGRFDLQSRSA